MSEPSRTMKKKWIKYLLLLMILAAFFWVAGCISTVTPPRDPEDPVTVYLVEGPCHAGVVLPKPQGGMVDFTYGDWDWFATNHDSWYHAFDTILWPTQGALGRRGLPTRDRVALEARFPPDWLKPFQASREKAAKLLGILESRFRVHEAESVFNSRFGLTFVPDDQGYWFLKNCNDTTADWLRMLDCSVSWVPIRLGLRLGR